MDGCSSIEMATCSLVREYLSRKGLKRTLEKMDEECPRHEQSISNRQALMRFVHLDKLMKKNKEQRAPLKTMLEVMTQYFLEKGGPNQKRKDDGDDRLFDDDSPGLKNDTDFMPQGDEPGSAPLMKSLVKPSTASMKYRRDKSNDLIMDDDVEGETMLGGGKAGLFASDNSSENVITPGHRQQSKRPLSAKQKAGAIVSNNDLLSSRRMRVPSAKTAGASRFSASQQQLKQSNEPSINQNINNDHASNIRRDYDHNNSPLSPTSVVQTNLSTKDNKSFNETKSQGGSSHISFEALLMKGEERANLLQRVGLDKRSNQVDGEGYNIEHSSMVAERPPSRHSQRKSSKSMPSNTNKTTDLEIGDVDDLDQDVSGLELQRGTSMIQQPNQISKLHSVPIDMKTAMNLKNLVLGSPCQHYSEEWSLQSFSFCDMPDLKYGIVQKKGGPCGVLAAVQACLVQELLFGSEKLHIQKWSNPTRPERTKFLCHAIAKILWRAGNEERAVVTIPTQTSHLVTSSKFKQDSVTETLSLYTFTSFEELLSFLSQSVSQFETDGNPGVILLIYSAILSRKPHVVKSDFDVTENKMIAVHGYCTQELVNLILTGRAVSNVFNDVVELNSGDGQDSVILKGLSGRSDTGLLSLFEHYKSCQVGTYYKTPRYPVWVICSESHFSVLFSTRKDLVNDWKAEKRFDLIYYDGLARQQEEIRLTISTINPSYKPPSSEDDLIPPLDLIIRTKWEDAEIDWNGYDPIL